MKHFCRFAVATALAVFGACMSPHAAAGDDDDAHQKRACLDMDVVVTTRIEDHGAAQLVSAVDLAKAAFQQMEARALCGAGLVSDALNAYARIRFPACGETPCRPPSKTD